MSEEAGVVAGGEVASAAPEPITTNDAPLTVREAVTAAAERHKRERETPTTDGAQPAATETKSAVEAGTAPLDEAPGETRADDPAEMPPIEPPRSWTKDVKERFAALPRDVQEEIARIEQSREREVRQSQNDTAEERKAVKAEREAADKARKDYEAKVTEYARALQNNSQFADIQTMDDVKRLQGEDPFRFQAYQVYQWELATADNERKQAEQRQKHEQSEQWANFQREQTAKAIERHPELGDSEKSKQFQTAAVELFKDAGFTEERLSAIANGEKLSPFSHEFQTIILKAVKYDQAQKNAPKAIPKPVPVVQRPGIAPARGASGDANIQEASRRFTQAPNIRNAAALYAAKQANKR